MKIDEILQTIEDLYFIRGQAKDKAAEAEDEEARGFWATYEDIIHIALLSAIDAVKEVCE